MEQLWLILKYAILGLVQGFTEPIPISSSGHIMILQHLFQLEIDGLGFAVLVNFASLLAILVIYRHDLWRIIGNSLAFLSSRSETGRDDFRFLMYLVIATIPAALIGYFFNDLITDALESLKTIGVTLLITGVVLWLIRKLEGYKRDGDLTWKDALIVGCAQAIALIPGMSRSGTTIVAALGMGMKRETALRFSFLMYIPVSIGSMMLEGADLIKDPQAGELFVPYLIAFILSFIMSYFALRWFMGVMARGNLVYFSIYCFVVGTAVLIFL